MGESPFLACSWPSSGEVTIGRAVGPNSPNAGGACAAYWG
jgi:hypothetical protein